MWKNCTSEPGETESFSMGQIGWNIPASFWSACSSGASMMKTKVKYSWMLSHAQAVDYHSAHPEIWSSRINILLTFIDTMENRIFWALSIMNTFVQRKNNWKTNCMPTLNKMYSYAVCKACRFYSILLFFSRGPIFTASLQIHFYICAWKAVFFI